MTQPVLSSALLRESGYSRHVTAGFLNLLGIAVQDGVFTMISARWDIYERGVLGADADAEAITILVLEEVFTRPLHKLLADPFDMVKRARTRMSGVPNCTGTIVAVDLGGSEGGGEGYLLGSQIREQMETTFSLRTVSDTDLPAPVWDNAHRSFKMSPEALIGALASRAASRQVLISDEASVDARRILTDALRQAGSVEPRSAPSLTRLIAWCAEITGRPLLSALVDLNGGGSMRNDMNRMRIVR